VVAPALVTERVADEGPFVELRKTLPHAPGNSRETKESAKLLVVEVPV